MHDDARLLPTQCYVWGKRPTTRGGLWYVTVPAGGGLSRIDILSKYEVPKVQHYATSV